MLCILRLAAPVPPLVTAPPRSMNRLVDYDGLTAAVHLGAEYPALSLAAMVAATELSCSYKQSNMNLFC